MSIKDNLLAIEKNIKSDTILVAVSKGRTVEEIEEVYNCGVRNIGENRIQEAIPKIEKLKSLNIIWHFVGHLQSNKAKYAVQYFNLIHSIDKIETLKELDRYSKKFEKVQEILIQVNTSQEATKFGIRPDCAIEFVKEACEFQNIKIKGVMTIGPLTSDEGRIRDSFKKLSDMRENLKSLFPQIDWIYLSMGMTDDYKIALEYGANIIRIGRAIFG